MSNLISLPFETGGGATINVPGDDNLLTGTGTHALTGNGSNTGWKLLTEVCFLKDSLITLSDKSKKSIQDLTVEDTLLSYQIEDFDNFNQDLEYVLNWYSDDFKGLLSSSNIVSIQKNNSNKYMIINHKIKVTLEHMLLIKNNDSIEWFPAKDITKEHFLFTEKGIFEPVTSIEIREEVKEVYNLKLEGIMNYFVEDYLVHSSSKCDECQK